MKIFVLTRKAASDGEARAIVVIAKSEWQARHLAAGRRVDTDKQGAFLDNVFKDEGPGPWLAQRMKQSKCVIIGQAAPNERARVVVVD